MIKLPDWFNTFKGGRSNFENFNTVPKAEDLSEGAIECIYEKDGDFHLGKLRSVDTEGEGYLVQGEGNGIIHWSTKVLIKEENSIEIEPIFPEKEESGKREWQVIPEGLRLGELIMYTAISQEGKPVVRLRHGRKLIVESNIVQMVEMTADTMYRMADENDVELNELYDEENTPDYEDE